MAETKKNEGKQENVQDNQDNQAATATVAAPSDSVAEAADPKPAKPVSKTVKAGEGFTHVNVRFKPDGKAKVKDLHRATVQYVAAPAQASRFQRIASLLTQEEEDAFRRGRNTAPHSVPKAASRGEYQTATGLEALFGWLYLQGRTDRLNELFEIMMGDDTQE